MPQRIHSSFSASITDLKKNPMEVVESGDGEAVVILNRNTPVFYCVPAELYDLMIKQLESANATPVVKANFNL